MIGYDLNQVIKEYQFLRQQIFYVLDEESIIDSFCRNFILDLIEDSSAKASVRFVNYANQNLNLANTQLEAIFETSAGAMVFFSGPDYVYERLNDKYQEIMPGRKLKGLPVFEAVPEFRGTEFEKILNEAFYEGKAHIVREGRVDIKDPHTGKTTPRYFDAAFSQVKDHDGKVIGVFHSATEVTDRVHDRDLMIEQERQLRETKNTLDLALDVTKVGFFDWDVAKDVMTFSKQFRSDWGVPFSLKFNEILSCVHPEDQERVGLEVAAAIKEHRDYKIEYRIIRPTDKKELWIVAHGRASYNEKNEPIRFFGTTQDISFRKESERIIQDSYELRDRFVAALSHDLRTPLAAARISAQLLLRKSDDPVQLQKHLSRIIENMDRSDSMIKDILDTNLIKSDMDLPLNIETFDLKILIEEVVEDLSSLHGDRFVTNLPGKIVGSWDYDKLKRVLENLSSNAIKYGSISEAVTIQANQNKDRICIRIINKGNPISPEDQNEIFRPYQRLESAKKSQKGWGIGLMLVRGFTEAQGGTVSVKSSQEDGTVFTLDLPTHVIVEN